MIVPFATLRGGPGWDMSIGVEGQQMKDGPCYLLLVEPPLPCGRPWMILHYQVEM